MFSKAMRLRDAQDRVEQAELRAGEVAARLQEQPEQEILRREYRRLARELDEARDALARVMTESGEAAGPEDQADRSTRS